MTATKAVKPTYRSGWCTTGAAAWSHAKCSHTYGHPPYEAVCSCQCHARHKEPPALDAAFARAVATVQDIIDHHDSVAVWFPRQVALSLTSSLHAAYLGLWDVPLDKPIEVAG